MKVYNFEFTGCFNNYGKTTVAAPSEELAEEIFRGIDHGDGWGICYDGYSIKKLGAAYECNANEVEWLKNESLGLYDTF